MVMAGTLCDTAWHRPSSLAQSGADLASDVEVGILSDGKVWQGTAEAGMYKQGLA